MAKFEVRTSGYSYSEGDANRLEKLGFKFEDKVSPYRHKTKGMLWDQDEVEVEINTLEELIKFTDDWGVIVFDGEIIEIYDDYRE